ncbi:MAG TPA: hypothetical protein VIM02_04100 [Rhizomicrobium sp.]|jgi:hypothetical protein
MQTGVRILFQTMAGRRFASLASALALAPLGLAGCAAINGMQEPLTADQAATIRLVCPTQEQRAASDAMADGVGKRTYRDGVVADCVKMIDGKYADFKMRLHKDAAISNLSTDLLALGLSGAAALTTGATANQFAEGATVVTGARTAINKDVFYEQTLPAVEAAMDANRSKILASIINAEKSDPDGKSYTLAAAGIDLDSYEQAGNIYTAIAGLTQTASNTAQQAAATVTVAQEQPYYVAKIVAPDIFPRLLRVTKAIRSIPAGPPGQPLLDSIAKALAVPIQPGASFVTERADILNAINQRIHTSSDPATDMTKIEQQVSAFITLP